MGLVLRGREFNIECRCGEKSTISSKVLADLHFNAKPENLKIGVVNANHASTTKRDN